jgi:addiction module HigA family antidote
MSRRRDDERAAQEYADLPSVPPVHPGEILTEEFLRPLGISQVRLAADIGVLPRRINEICLGKRGITAETALLLGRFFGMGPEFWLSLQANYDVRVARAAMAAQLARVRPLDSASA